MIHNSSTITFYDRLAGVLFGTAVGDTIGLPAEGMSRNRIKKIYHGKWRHKFFFHTGMISDDTEHTIFVSQCLLAHAESPYLFGKRFSWCLRWWLLFLPAGVGFATLRLNNSDEGEGVLFGVAPKAQGRGIYRSFMVKGMEWCMKKNATHMVVSTQITNTAVQKVWSRVGFEPNNAYYTFHKWFD